MLRLAAVQRAERSAASCCMLQCDIDGAICIQSESRIRMCGDAPRARRITTHTRAYCTQISNDYSAQKT